MKTIKPPAPMRLYMRMEVNVLITKKIRVVNLEPFLEKY